MAKYHKGRFKPQHPEKYVGDATKIIYRSWWEFKLMSYCDKHSSIIEWSSEEVIVPYRSPIDGRMHRYFPDFVVQQKSKDGTIEVVMIEVKPKNQTKPPKIPDKNASKNKRFLNEVKTWGVNSAKWEAAEAYCKQRGWRFTIFTEDHLGIK